MGGHIRQKFIEAGVGGCLSIIQVGVNNALSGNENNWGWFRLGGPVHAVVTSYNWWLVHE